MRLAQLLRTTAYKVAYEIYNESLGVSTIAVRGAIRIDLTQPLVALDTANMVISSGNADFNSAGATYRWALLDAADAIVGYTPAAGLITPNLPFSIIAAPPTSPHLGVWILIHNESPRGAGGEVKVGG